jgi:methylated-DNA-[protein]-cysteine S-methyltransferase
MCLMPAAPQEIYYSRMSSRLGTLLLAAGKQGLRRLQLDGKLPEPPNNELWIESRNGLRDYEDQLQAYFHGNLRDFTCALDLVGTDFQKRCWWALRTIPYGETRSYAEIAKQIGAPRAFRAVGHANHANPIAIIIPCHRVIGSGGALTGYGGGLSMKEELLRLESSVCQASFQFAAVI